MIELSDPRGRPPSARRWGADPRRLGVALSFIGAAGSVAGLVFFALQAAALPHPLGREVSKALYLFGPVVSGLLGALLVSRRPDNATTWAVVAVAFTQGLSAASQQFGAYEVSAAGHLSFAGAAFAWLSNWTWVPNLCAVYLVFMLFPTGRLPARVWWGFVGLLVVFFVPLLPVLATFPVLDCCSGYSNPFAVHVAVLRSFFTIAGPILGHLTQIFLGLCVVAGIHRYVRSSAEERVQIRWLAFAGALGVAAQIFGHTGPWGHPGPWGDAVSQLSFYGIAAAITVAILRYRLYDIDRILNRTVVYALVTGALAGVYLGIVLLAGLVGPLDQDSPVAVAFSTLVVAALFRPARGRVQAFIDRRFNRARYDTARTLQDFSARLREQVDIDSLGSQLLGVVGNTMQPSTAALWLRPSGPEAGRELEP